MAITRRRDWRRRMEQAVRVLLAAAMVLQISAGGLSLAFAADEGEPSETVLEQEEGLTEEEQEGEAVPLFQGDLPEGGAGLTTIGAWRFENGCASTTTDGAGADWSTMLKYPVQLEAGWEYEVSVTLLSTAERTVTLDMGDMDPREYTSDLIPAN